MNKLQAFDFLKDNQPLPSDELLTESIIAEYDEVRGFFIDKPDKESISLFLNSFGEGDGLGVYQLVEDVFSCFSIDDMLEPLSQALLSQHSSVRYWCTQICASFPDSRLIPSLRYVLNDERVDTREAAIIALDIIGSNQSITLLKEAFLKETDPEIKELIKDIIE